MSSLEVILNPSNRIGIEHQCYMSNNKIAFLAFLNSPSLEFYYYYCAEKLNEKISNLEN